MDDLTESTVSNFCPVKLDTLLLRQCHYAVICIHERTSGLCALGYSNEVQIIALCNFHHTLMKCIFFVESDIGK